MTKIVGICNISPDSFSDGQTYAPEELHSKIEKLWEDGADIVDIGAEASGPNATELSLRDELERLEAVRDIIQSIPGTYSLDTRKATVAKVGLANGISIINDISGGRHDDAMYTTIANSNAQYVMMYARTENGFATREPLDPDTNIMEQIYAFFDFHIPLAHTAGIRDDQLIIDPGMGSFISPHAHHSVAVLQSLPYLIARYNLPVFIGTSRKGFHSQIVPDEGPNDRLGSSLATSLYAAQQGAEYVRVHDVHLFYQTHNTYNKIIM